MSLQPQKPTPKPAAAPPKEALKAQVNLKSVHGLMVDPFTGIHYHQNSNVPYVASSWVDSQLQAGKLAHA